MPPAPAVQDLNTLIGQYTTALAPQSAEITQEENQNEQSGTAQQQGLDAAKTSAFGGITQSANDRGGYFSGFTPDAEAKYTAATYLPALAQLQNTIATTRQSLLGKQADLQTQANTSALTAQQGEQSDFEKYQEQQDADAQAEKLQQESEQATAQQNDLDRQATLEASQAKANTITPAQQQATDFSAANTYLQGKVGGDGKVSPNVFNAAKQQWVNAGYSAASFNSNFANYVNTTHKQDYGY